MSGYHRRIPRWSSCLLSLTAVLGLGLATVSAQASPPTIPLTPFIQAPAAADAAAAISQVGPQIVDIDTKLG
jgi:hypothetical protein